MDTEVKGLHRFTAIAGDPTENAKFYGDNEGSPDDMEQMSKILRLMDFEEKEIDENRYLEAEALSATRSEISRGIWRIQLSSSAVLRRIHISLFSEWMRQWRSSRP